MTTPTPSRTSSAPTPGSSRRPPSKLRVPSSSRKASNPSLSLIYASPGSPMPLRSDSSSSGSRSEEALSRQLDGDLGGKQMGLRSRRSSSATIRTVSGNGAGPQSPRESIMEEEEDSGPILERPVPMEAEGSEGGRIRTRLNPKASTSWLRWNSPTPSFPRSDKGKGKEREGTVGDRTPRRASTVGGDSLGRQSSRLSAQTTRRESSDTREDVLAVSPERRSEPLNDQPPNINTIPTPATVPAPPPPMTIKARGWFSRNPPPEPKPPAPVDSPAPKASDSALADTPVESSETPTEIAQALNAVQEHSAPNDDAKTTPKTSPAAGLVVGAKPQVTSSEDQPTEGTSEIPAPSGQSRIIPSLLNPLLMLQVKPPPVFNNQRDGLGISVGEEASHPLPRTRPRQRQRNQLLKLSSSQIQHSRPPSRIRSCQPTSSRQNRAVYSPTSMAISTLKAMVKHLPCLL